MHKYLFFFIALTQVACAGGQTSATQLKDTSGTLVAQAASGKFGIGTTTPAYPLDVTESSNTANGINVNIASGSASNHALTLTTSAGNLFDVLGNGVINVGGIGFDLTCPLQSITSNANTLIFKNGFGGPFGGTNYAFQQWTDNQNNPHLAFGITAGINTSSGGLVGINVPSGTTPTAQLEIDSSIPGNAILNAVGAASQTADLVDVTAHGGAQGAVARVSAGGAWGGTAFGTQTVSSTSFTATVGANAFSGSTASQTITLPAPSGQVLPLFIKNRSSVTVTVASASGSQIYTSSTQASVTLTAGTSLTLWSDGTYWNQ